MFEYVFDLNNSPQGSLDTTGFCNDFSEIKQDVLSQTAECTHRRSTYPNGFILEVEQHSDRFIIRTNWELIQNPSGDWSVQKPE